MITDLNRKDARDGYPPAEGCPQSGCPSRGAKVHGQDYQRRLEDALRLALLEDCEVEHGNAYRMQH